MDCHLATVTAVLNSFLHTTSFFQEMGTGTSRKHKAETRIEAPKLLRKVQEQSFLFISKIIYKVFIANKSFLLSQFQKFVDDDNL